jgi:hypothetical protein
MIKIHIQIGFIAALSFVVAAETPNPVTFDGDSAATTKDRAAMKPI